MHILEVARIEARIEPFDFAFDEQYGAAIDADWAARLARQPALFDGVVLLQHRLEIADGVARAGYFATRYSRFLAWRHRGWRMGAVRNGFAMAALRASDGAFLLGRMGGHTANAGQVYFAAGTPDLDDVTPDGRVDLAGGAVRELGEETGLTPDEVVFEDRWTLVIGGPWCACLRPARLRMPAEEARAVILSRIAGQADPELSDVVIARSPADLARHACPAFLAAYLTHVWSE